MNHGEKQSVEEKARLEAEAELKKRIIVRCVGFPLKQENDTTDLSTTLPKSQ
jgi:hypothetical protein